ncbi:hypothetical protein Lalb_Chr23g0275351 [Lupinus albus]|uniref:Uncharacterized protein n=1 Tax=Lupinus albus TaxID=3870 RepID=A0A6A4NLP4_LUPAL|nr:hypothetical protein Lalb_Chr23g0275351 [Lupinus albus]
MAELSRSIISFRRYGSSGLVWNDNIIFSVNVENQNQGVDNGSNEIIEVRESQSVRSVPIIDRSKSEAQGMPKITSLSKGPSSIKGTHWFCGIFRKLMVTKNQSKPKSKKLR